MKQLSLHEIDSNDTGGIAVKTVREILNFIEARMQEDKVFLFTYSTDVDGCSQNEVIVTQNYSVIDSFVSCHEEMFEDEINSYTLQEYQSFKNAYDSALIMREGKTLSL